MVTIRNLEFAHPGSSFMLRVAGLAIEQGKHVALVGPSGCGKTTLLNLISGNLRPQSGVITVCDQTIALMPDAPLRRFRLRTIGQVFQEFELLDYLTALANILLPATIDGSDTEGSKELRNRALRLLTEVGLGGREGDFPGRMSQGEQQRIAIARAVIASPKLILADEPTGNLDPSNKTRVLDLLIEQARLSGAGLITVTHDTSLLNRFDRVIDFNELTGTVAP